MDNHTDIWIKTGYEICALQGFDALKIETLSKKVGISKSSFYHHFVDLPIFITHHLLKYHLQQSHIIAKKEQNCTCINPELINILIEHKIDLLFNRQLRIHNENNLFTETLSQSNAILGNSFVLIWIKELNLCLNENQLAGLFELALENFYLQINHENLNQNWLSAYFDNLKKIAKNFA